MYDVVVIGAGPAGISAAKRCADSGFKTLLLEKEELPRKKACDGELNPRTQEIIQAEFGEIPQSILSVPSSLDGLIFYMPDGSPPAKYEFSMPWLWRYKLDHWMCEKAVESGVELKQAAQFVDLSSNERGYEVRYRTGQSEETIDCEFVIGADGCASRVRQSIFPELKLRYYYQAQERFKEGTDLDRRWIHEFIMFEGLRGYTMISTYHKDELYIISYLTDTKGQMNEFKAAVHKYLAKNHQFNPDQVPEWTVGCVEPIFGEDLASYRFRPADGNALLAGDAAGLMFPATLEGIGPAARSGLNAAEACKVAHDAGGKAAPIYLEKIEPLISLTRTAQKYEDQIMAEIRAKNYQGVAELRNAVPHHEIYTQF
jgi:flavin-dependent dehydrogenase